MFRPIAGRGRFVLGRWFPGREGQIDLRLDAFPFGLGGGHGGVQLLQLLLLVSCGSRNVRGRVSILGGSTFFRHVIEQREGLVILALGEGIELVIVAPGTAHRQPHPDREGRIDPVHDVLDGILFRDDASFRVATMVAVESCRDSLVQGRIRQ